MGRRRAGALSPAFRRLSRWRLSRLLRERQLVSHLVAARIRQNGDIVCAAMSAAQPGDYYIDDGVHYQLSVELHALVTDAEHLQHGLWWWVDDVPDGVEVDRWWVSARD